MTFASALRDAEEVVLHISAMHTHSLKVTKSQIRQLAKGRSTTLNDYALCFDEWVFDGYTLHVHT